MSNIEQSLGSNVVGQWIISLAISVVCCAFLFVLSAYYVTNQNMAVSTVAVRVDVMQQRQDLMSLELDRLRRQVVQQSASASIAQPATAVVSPTEAPEQKQ
jgi:hypothetical protein